MIIIKTIILYFIQIRHTDDFPSTGTRLVIIIHHNVVIMVLVHPQKVLSTVVSNHQIIQKAFLISMPQVEGVPIPHYRMFFVDRAVQTIHCSGDPR